MLALIIQQRAMNFLVSALGRRDSIKHDVGTRYLQSDDVFHSIILV